MSRIHTYAVDPDDLEELITRPATLIAAVRSVYSGLIDTPLLRNADGTYTDVWQWESMEALVAAGPFTVVDRDTGAARAVAAACTAWYLGAMGEVYPRLVAAQGLGAEVALVRTANPAGGREPGVVPDAAQILLDEFTAYGDAASVQEQLQQWDIAVDITMVGVPPGMPWPRIEATLHGAAPG